MYLINCGVPVLGQVPDWLVIGLTPWPLWFDSPEQTQFLLLKTFLEGVRDVGLFNMLTAQYEYREEPAPGAPFGFAPRHQREILKGLHALFPAVIHEKLRQWFTDLVERAPLEWISTNSSSLREGFDLITLFSDLFANASHVWCKTHHQKIKILLGDLPTDATQDPPL